MLISCLIKRVDCVNTGYWRNACCSCSVCSQCDLWLIGRAELVRCLMFGSCEIEKKVDRPTEKRIGEWESETQRYCVYIIEENQEEYMVCIEEWKKVQVDIRNWGSEQKNKTKVKVEKVQTYHGFLLPFALFSRCDQLLVTLQGTSKS